ncbi:hypothetical protein GE09DRAFT_1149699 [Coniochaeta sp. 2T2.1]|nr:hypothetical protein GE09DRAFT_1149699 [Coniochaeta sp. 2T2.1]
MEDACVLDYFLTSILTPIYQNSRATLYSHGDLHADKRAHHQGLRVSRRDRRPAETQHLLQGVHSPRCDVGGIAGTGHVLAATSYNLADLQAKTFIKLRKKLTTPIKFTIKSIILEPGSNTACVETQGHATRLIGKLYNNEYIWLTTWNSAGKMVHIRSYFDSKLAEDTLRDPDAQQNHES